MTPITTHGPWLHGQLRSNLLEAARAQYHKNLMAHVSQKIVLSVNSDTSETLFLEIERELPHSPRTFHVTRIFMAIDGIRMDFIVCNRN